MTTTVPTSSSKCTDSRSSWQWLISRIADKADISTISTQNWTEWKASRTLDASLCAYAITVRKSFPWRLACHQLYARAKACCLVFHEVQTKIRYIASSITNIKKGNVHSRKYSFLSDFLISLDQRLSLGQKDLCSRLSVSKETKMKESSFASPWR